MNTAQKVWLACGMLAFAFVLINPKIDCEEVPASMFGNRVLTPAHESCQPFIGGNSGAERMQNKALWLIGIAVLTGAGVLLARPPKGGTPPNAAS